jgi:hypothetical protein
MCSAGNSDQSCFEATNEDSKYNEVLRTRQDQTRPTPSPEGGSSFWGRFHT